MQRIFVLDTNVLMHDPTALFRFEEHDIFLPMVVLEELDNGKKGQSDVARNVRQVSRFLDEIIKGRSREEIQSGLPLPSQKIEYDARENAASGRLYLQTQSITTTLPDLLPGNKPDNSILATALHLHSTHSDRRVTLVSKDINLRIKAGAIGLHAEDYSNDKVLDDLDLLYSGYAQLPADFWATHDQNMESWQTAGRSYYRVQGPLTKSWQINQFLHFEDPTGPELMVREIKNGNATLEVLRDFRAPKHAVWGVHARNAEQNFALNLLMDPEIDFVSLLGAAGTGKTLLALAAGLAQTLDDRRYREIIMTRVTVPVGEDIGFLPGTEEEKMTPWMGALMDNLEVLTQVEGSDWERAAANDLLSKRIKIRSLNFMRGRTFLNRYIILDEAQNLTAKQMRTLITRAGPGSKVVVMGNLTQIDTPYLTETTSGLTYAVDRMRGWAHAGHVTLARGERSRLAAHASAVL